MTFTPWKLGLGDTAGLGAADAGGSAAMFVSWLNLADSDGGKLANYRLFLHTSDFSFTSNLCGTAVEYLYVFTLAIGAHAAALQNIILNPDAWLTPLSNLYGTLTGKIYGAIPPVILAIGAFATLAFSIYLRRGPSGSAVQVSKAQWSRLSSGVILLGMVAILAANPLRIIKDALGYLLGFASFLTHTGDDGGIGTRVHSGNADLLRSLTFLMNWRSDLNTECARDWSHMINTGGGPPGCAAQLPGSSPNPASVLAALLGLAFVVAMFYFAAVVGAYLFNQVGLTIVYLTGLVYIAVAAILKRRPYDPLSRTLARAGVHALLALGYWFVAALIPGALIVVGEWATQHVPTWVAVAIMGVVYFYLAKLIRNISKNRESLYSLFRDRIERSQRWKVFYSESGPTVLGTMMQGAAGDPKAWAAEQYNKTRDAVAGHWNRFLRSGADSEGVVMTTPQVLPDTPEFAAVLTRADTYTAPPGERPATVSGDDMTTPAALGGVLVDPLESQDYHKIVVIEPGGRVEVGRPAQLSDLTRAIDSETPTALPPVFFRGGIPHLGGPLVAARPEASAPPTSAGQRDDLPPALTGFADAMADHWRRIDARANRLYEEASALNRRGARSADSTADQIDRGTAVFGGAPPVDAAAAPAGGRKGDAGTLVQLRTLLDSSARAQRLIHNRNLLRARGVTAPVTIPDEDESAQGLYFVVDRSGRKRVRPRLGLGFGDAI